MSIKKTMVALMIGMASMLVITSCSTKQSTINQMERLANDIRDNGSYYTTKDWENAVQDFWKIRKKMAKFDYTPAERKTIGELESQCARYMAKGIKDGAINGIMGVANEIRGILDGLGIKY